MSEKAVHLGHTVSTTDQDCITMAAKNNLWKIFYLFIASFEQLYCCAKIKLFNQFCCIFYVSPLRHLNDAALWGVHPTTHCNVITTCVNPNSLIVTLQNRFIRFMSICLSNSNCILKLISHCVISNPMSAAGKSYRSFIDDDGEYNNSRSVMKWTNLPKYSFTIELIDIRDGHKKCIRFSSQELDVFMLDLCTG